MDKIIAAKLPSIGLYNGLPTLESAHDFVTKNGLVDMVIRDIGPLFFRWGVHGSWGIYLMHNHWNLKPGEFAGEDVKVWSKDQQEYMLRPVNAGKAGYVPITYALRDGVFQPLEFSQTPEGLAAHALLMSKTEFLSELKNAMLARGLHQHFGLGLIRDVADEKHRWVEFTAEAERMSVTKYVPSNYVASEHLIQTSWAFDGGPRRGCNYRCGNCYSAGGGHASSTR